MNTETNTGPGENRVQTDRDKLLASQHEIHELTLQFALGKAVALTKFEEVKNDFSRQIREIKESLTQLADVPILPEVWVKLNDLEMQLSIGEANSKSLFEEQKTKIINSLVALEDVAVDYLKSHHPWKEFRHEAEKFKLKLEVLRLRFVLKKFEVTDEYESLMKEALGKIEKLTSKGKEIREMEHEVLGNIKDEIAGAYKHIRKAIRSLK